ncbi:alpha/beta hydrolase family protein [Aquimarina sp. 2201CG14-23]|uniref:alpha/beta hydrolase family protein n=1 Tax=Aquimarina mycalae TaxID=3040073 RepID=UPI0024781177|nr:prolyl oligopeptidase family serine peptidase [Aquimarina sp. 2201CG14-23]MDH7445615.1 prolyl oligopeptidase family serine peptidase [Aquimarina sp. 2201CG14-23]
MCSVKVKVVTFLSFLCLNFGFTQKKALSHKDYDLWKNIIDIEISTNGKLIISTIETVTKRGDGYLEIYNTTTNKKYVFKNGYNASITKDEAYVIFKQRPNYQDIRNEIKNNIKQKERSKSKLLIFNVAQGKVEAFIPRIKMYKIPKSNSAYLVMECYANKNMSNKTSPKLYNQNYAIIYNFKSKNRDTIFKIKEFTIPESGNVFYYSTTMQHNKTIEAKQSDLGVYAYDIKFGTIKVIDTTKYRYTKLSSNKQGNSMVFLSVKDSKAMDSLNFTLNLYTNDTLKKITDTSGKGLKNDWILSSNKGPKFSKSGDKLYFFSKPKSIHRKDTTLLSSEIPEVDIWNWQDQFIQPEQEANLIKLKRKSYVSFYDINTNKFIHIQDRNIDVIYMNEYKEQKYILGSDKNPYQKEYSWKYPRMKDFYVINKETGEKRLAIRNARNRPFLSPDNKYAVYYDSNQKDWFSLELSNLKLRNLTNKLNVIFYDKENDRPSLPLPHGFGGFDQNGNALVYAQFDIWRIFLDGSKKPLNITKIGNSEKIVFRTEMLDKEQETSASYLNNKLLVTSFDKKTKASGLYLLDKGQLVEKIKPTNFLIKNYTKAPKSDVLTFTKENFTTPTDLYFSYKDFDNVLKITNVNPQQKDFKWGTAELFYWTAYDGKKLEGIIYKPEDFDPFKKYPMITHFYEKKSDTYSEYHIPKPSKSTVNRSYLVSNDYVLFVPNIIYNEGKPGASAYNCILSGVEAVEKLGYIDSNNLAIQGQSWGGYQVAYLITTTNKFKAAMSGAPVSNMTSAYGGIRWESGRSRAFQYEKGQSRIGKNLWERPDLYIKNSPLFGIPNIETPLLIMHNDQDGAVPYYQGIEMFMGMRRLEKPVWLLVYNNEEHNLKKMKNKQDLSIRMMQFFDHYLKNKQAPRWMTKGISRVNKGIDLGYELDIENKN